MRNIKYIPALLICLSVSILLKGQTQDTTKKAQTDIMKEFDLNSFKDASTKITDSSALSLHIIGVKWGYGISNVSFSVNKDHKAIKTPVNLGVYYTYYHSLWNKMPYFGLHTGIGVTELGFIEITGKDDNKVETERRYRAVEIPFMTQFRVDFWRLRVMLGVGAFGTYIISNQTGNEIPSTTNRAGGGIIGGGGVAFIMKPFEIHLECNYKYTLSHFLNPRIYSEETWVYTHSNQLQFSIGLYYRLGKNSRSYKKH